MIDLLVRLGLMKFHVQLLIRCEKLNVSTHFMWRGINGFTWFPNVVKKFLAFELIFHGTFINFGSYLTLVSTGQRSNFQVWLNSRNINRL